MHRTARLILAPLALLLGVVMTLAPIDATTAPAEAALWGFSMKHGNDTGYDPSIIINCAGVGGRQYLHEGQHSDDVCRRAGGDEHVLGFYLRDLPRNRSEALVCLVGAEAAVWETKAKTPGWHRGGARLVGWNPCVLQVARAG